MTSRGPWSALGAPKTSPACSSDGLHVSGSRSTSQLRAYQPCLQITNLMTSFFQCTLRSSQDTTKPAYSLQPVLGGPIVSFIKQAHICALKHVLCMDIFIAATCRCSAFPHLSWAHCCWHWDADLQVNGKTRPGVTNGKGEYDSYLKRLTFSLLCHCTL